MNREGTCVYVRMYVCICVWGSTYMWGRYICRGACVGVNVCVHVNCVC